MVLWVPTPHCHHPRQAEPAGSLTRSTGERTPNTIRHLNSCRFAALWHFQGNGGCGVHHCTLSNVNIHLDGTRLSPQTRLKGRKGALLPPLQFLMLTTRHLNGPKAASCPHSRGLSHPRSRSLRCRVCSAEAASAVAGQRGADPALPQLHKATQLTGACSQREAQPQPQGRMRAAPTPGPGCRTLWPALPPAGLAPLTQSHHQQPARP